MLQYRKEHSEENIKHVRSNGSKQVEKASQVQHLIWGLTKKKKKKRWGLMNEYIRQKVVLLRQ